MRTRTKLRRSEPWGGVADSELSGSTADAVTDDQATSSNATDPEAAAQAAEGVEGTDPANPANPNYNPYLTDLYTAAEKAAGVTSVALPATIESVDLGFFQLFPNAAAISVAQDNSHLASYNGALYSADMTHLLLVPEGMEGSVVLPVSLASVPVCVFTRCTKLLAIDFPTGSTNETFATLNGILYTSDMNTLLAAPAGIDTSVTIAAGAAHIAEGAFWGNAALRTIVAQGNVVDIVVNPAFDPATTINAGQQHAAIDTDVPAFDPAVIEAATVVLADNCDRGAWEAAGFTNFQTPAQPGDQIQPAEGSGFAFQLLDDHTLAVRWDGGANNDATPAAVQVPDYGILNGVRYQVSTVAEGAFAGQTGIVTVDLPDSVTTVGARAFDGCTSLKTIHLSNATEVLGDRALADTALLSLVLPVNLTAVGSQALSGLNGTTVVACHAVVDVAQDALLGATNVNLYVPTQAADTWNGGLPTANNHIYMYGVQTSDDMMQLAPGETVPLFAEGALQAPGNVQVEYTYKAKSMSIAEDGTVEAKQPGASQVTATLTLPIEEVVVKGISSNEVRLEKASVRPVSDAAAVETVAITTPLTLTSADQGISVASTTAARAGYSGYVYIHSSNVGISSPDAEGSDKLLSAGIPTGINPDDTYWSIRGGNNARLYVDLLHDSTVGGTEYYVGVEVYTESKITLNNNPTLTYAHVPTGTTAPSSGTLSAVPSYREGYDLHVFASWKADITWNPNGGYFEINDWSHDSSPQVSTLTVGNTATGPDAGTPMNPGYNFKGWASSSTATTGSTSVAIGDVATYYAVWESPAKKITINKGTGVKTITQSKTTYTPSTSSQTFTVSATALTGYNANKLTLTQTTGTTGLSFSSQGTSSTVTVTIPANKATDLTLTASLAANTYTITPTKGTGVNSVTLSKTSYTYSTSAQTFTVSATPLPGYQNSNLSLTGVTPSNLAFSSVGGASVTVTIPAGCTSNISFTATLPGERITLTWKTDANTTFTTTTQTYAASSKVILPTTNPKKDNYDFEGWYTEANGGTRVTGNTALPTDNEIYYAYWTPVGHAVEVDANGGVWTNGTDFMTLSYAHGDVIKGSDIEAPTRDGYQFTGCWYWRNFTNTQSGFWEPDLGGLTVTDDLVLEADWLEDTADYTVEFYYENVNGGYDKADSETLILTGTIGETVTYTPPAPPYDDLWLDTNRSTLSGVIQADSSLVLKVYYTLMGGNLIYMWGSDVVPSGVALPSDSTWYRSGQRVKLADKPSKPGYTFEGWKVTHRTYGTLLVDDNGYFTMVDDDVVVTGTWTAKTINISWDANGGDPGYYETKQEYSDNATVVIPDFVPERPGYTLVGWSTSWNDDGEIITDKTPLPTDGPIAYYAVWEGNTITIKWNSDESTTWKTTTQVYSENAKVTIPDGSYPYRAGYAFESWRETPSGLGFVSEYTKLPTEDVTYYARYEAIKYYLDFDGNGATSGSMDRLGPIYVKDGYQHLPENQYARTGYTFQGWSWGPTGTATFPDGESFDPYLLTDEYDVVDVNIDYELFLTWYAVWKANTYTVKFNGGEGSSGSMTDQKMTYGTAANLSTNAFTKEGYTFKGWTTTEGGTTVEYTNGASVLNLTDESNGTVTLYAVWEVFSCMTVWDVNGGQWPDDVGLPDWIIANGFIDVQFDFGTFVNGPVYEGKELIPIREGYVFFGWENDKTGERYEYGHDLIEIDSTDYHDHEYNAIWDPVQYRVLFDGNGATSGSMDWEVYLYDESQELPTNQFQRTGYAFQGWSLISDGKEVDFVDGQEVSNLTTKQGEDITLYAVWKENEEASYTVEYYHQDIDGDFDKTTQTVPATTGEEVTLKTEPTATHYVLDSDTRNVLTGTVKSDNSLVLTVYYLCWDASVTYEWDSDVVPEGAELPTDNTTYRVGQTVTVADAPTADGYTFSGWRGTYAEFDGNDFSGADLTVSLGEDNTFTMPNTDVTFTGTWTANEASIVFDVNGGEKLDEIDLTGKTGDALDSTDLPGEDKVKKVGWYLAGWYDNVDLTGDPMEALPETFPAGITTYYAKWVPVMSVTAPVALTLGLTKASDSLEGIPVTASFVSHTPVDGELTLESGLSTDNDQDGGTYADRLQNVRDFFTNSYENVAVMFADADDESRSGRVPLAGTSAGTELDGLIIKPTETRGVIYSLDLDQVDARDVEIPDDDQAKSIALLRFVFALTE